ncbi:MAG TPA: long-chain fatty acid--CoA ligase [Ktedonobacteraceae bacterium]|nr:long-chain fatty acid--CoA ligase [Ktedonobacteraceae bacterium]
MTGEKHIRDLQDIRVLYDLAIYNYLHFGIYTMLIYEDRQQDEVREYTNVDVAREATQLAAGLQSLGIQKGDRVIVMMINSPEVIIAYQAIARVGAIIIPVLPLLKGPEVRYIAENSAAKAIITGSILLPLLQSALAGIDSLQHIIATGVEAKGGEADKSTVGTINRPLRAYRDIVAMGASYADRFLEDLEGISLSPDDTAVTIYTSGTTGRPKGVMLSHRNLTSNALSGIGKDRTERREQNQLTVLPLAHSYGLLVSNVSYLSGATIVMHPRFDTSAVLSAIERYRINGFAGVPAMYVALLYTPDADKYDTSSLENCVCGSAPLPIAVLEAFEQKFGCRILEGYGLTEASTVLTGHSVDMVRKPGSVGTPVEGVEIRIVDENDQPVPTGEVGEIIARGANIMQGYYNMPEETRAALRNGWLYTGDMGRLDEDGYLYIVERKKDLIIRGGFNIYPRDVEEVLNRHPTVIESAVIGIPSVRMGEEVKAFVVTNTDVDAETLKAFCQEALANYKTPSEIEFVNALPRNLVGKIDKKELRRGHVH